MAGNTVSRPECERIHNDLNTTLKSMHDDLVLIRDNHLAHIDSKIDGLNELTDKKIDGLSQKLDTLQLALVLVGVLAGINVLDIILKAVGV